MGKLSSWLRVRKTTASVAAIAVLAGVPLTFAVLHQGFPVTDVDLTARDVWVTNGKELLAGRLNRQIEELNGAVNASSNTFDVLQDGDDVFMYDESIGTLDRVDPAFTTLGQRVDLPPGAELAYGGDTIAVLAPSSGEVWLINAASDLNFNPESTDPTMKLGKGAHVAVSEDGRVFGTSPSKKKLLTLDSIDSKPSESGLPSLGDHQLAAVGDEAVILDTESEKLIVGGGATIDVPGGLKLQQTGAENDFALVATGDSLLQVPLGGGEPTKIGADIANPLTDPKDVSSPVWLNGCAHGAWAGAQKYLAACTDKKPRTEDIEQVTQGSTLEFRVNRNIIALNNLSNGNVWLVDANMRLVDNWDEVTPPEEEDSEEGDEKASQQSFEDTLAERTPQNRAPLAHDDDYGVRAGKTTVLPVLDNDTDPDGDVLTVVNVNGFTDAKGKLDYIDGGRALQFTPDPGLAGTVNFRYTVADGRGAVAEANVNLTLHPEGQNEAPVSHRAGAMTVEQGQLVSYNVLTDWIDPDGDDIYLVSASPTTGDSVRFGPEGFVTFESKTAELGPKEVQFVVSDGTMTATGVLTVDVQAPGTLNPVGTPDFASTFVGETVLVEPLANDVTPSGAPLTLIGVNEVPDDVTAVPNLERGTVAVSAPAPGSYVFTYSLGAGATSSIGLIRVDVKEEPPEEVAPIAVKDIAYLRAGEPLSVPVLDNDVSPSGRILAVQSVDTTTTGDLVSVEVLTNTVLRVTASAALTEQVQFTYTISDGRETSTAGITVVPVPPLIKHQPPVAVDDSVNVRAGDIVSVSVLDNDYHPDSATMTVLPDLVDTASAGESLAFVTGNRVRFQAPEEPGSYSVAYKITDPFLETATALTHFTVVGPDDENNKAPTPLPLTTRTFADSTIKVQVPLDGIDPDGDSVFLKDVTTPPGMGRIVDQGSDFFTYEAYPGTAGTDSFEYEVQDALGKTATGTVRIGVIPRPEVLLPPNAVDDSIEIKPGRTGSIPVVLNDSDPNGYRLELSKKLPEVDEGISAEVEASRIVIEAPEVEGTYTLRYEITNGHGGADTAFVQVKVTEDAKPLYPSAKDHYIEPEDVLDKDSVTVDVLDGAENPSGRVDELKISLEGPNAASGDIRQKGKVKVTPTDERQAIAYRLTNEIDELSATAFIIVPAKPDSKDKEKEEEFPPPFLKPLPEQIVKKNGSITWNLADIVEVPSGKPAIILSASATNSNGSSPMIDPETLNFNAAPDYRGPASVTFVVTDGTSASDEKGRKATLTIPVTVGDPNFEDEPPTFTPPNVTIEAGEDPLVVNLRTSSAHPNPAILEQLSYGSLSGQTADVKADLGGADLSISAPLGVQPGTKVALKFNVTYKEFTVPGSVNVTVVSSTRAKPQAVDDSGPNGKGIETHPAETVEIPVLDNDYNPFAADGIPLKVIAASIEQDVSGGTASASFTASGVTIRTGPGATGTLTAVYRIQDGTKDPARETQGRIRLVIRDKPDKPAPPSATAGDGQVTITFKAPANNNSPITGYVVKYPGGTENGCTAGTKCVLPATNGEAFTATVAAVNAIDTGEQSGPSNSVTPYGKPTAPNNPKISSSGDAPADLSMSWGAPDQTGGGSVHYRWRLNGGQWNDTNSRKASINNRGAGTYNFDVVAVNDGGGGTGLGATSNTVQVNDPPPPSPSATPKRGAPDSTSGCDSGCFRVAFDYSYLKGGDYTVTVQFRDAGASGWSSLSAQGMNLGKNGSAQTYSMLGTVGEHDEVRVRFQGPDDFYSKVSGDWG